jgi:hypothetical protein
MVRSASRMMSKAMVSAIKDEAAVVVMSPPRVMLKPEP